MRLCFSCVTLVTAAAVAGDGQIDLLPDPASGLTISTPGSYVLVDNVTMTNIAATAINVNASDVTIDLNGHTLSCPGGTSLGIAHGTGSRLEVFGGTIRGFGAPGISTGSDDNIHDLRVDSCGSGIGINGSRGRVQNCIITGTSTGVYIDVPGDGTSVIGCQIMGNTGGIEVFAGGCHIVENVISANTSNGITVNSVTNALVRGNTLLNNGGFGISNTETGVGNHMFLGNSAAGNTSGNYSGIAAAFIVSLGSASSPPPAGANTQP